MQSTFIYYLNTLV